MDNKVVPVQADAQASVAQPEGSPVVASVVPTAVVSDRTTEQFEKLKDSNKKLFEANQLLQEELSRRAVSEQTFAPIQQTPQLNVPAPEIEQFVNVDPISGEKYVDEVKLSAALAESNKKATRAEVAVQNYIKQQNILEEERQTRSI